MLESIERLWFQLMRGTLNMQTKHNIGLLFGAVYSRYVLSTIDVKWPLIAQAYETKSNAVISLL